MNKRDKIIKKLIIAGGLIAINVGIMIGCESKKEETVLDKGKEYIVYYRDRGEEREIKDVIDYIRYDSNSNMVKLRFKDEEEMIMYEPVTIVERSSYNIEKQ